MKCCIFFSMVLLLGSAGCHSGEIPTSQAAPGFRYEELSQTVPPEFSDSAKWNQTSICPEGSILSPLTRYSYGPSEKTYGFKHYYGRSCQLVSQHTLESSKGNSSQLLPNGPFIWWYENGSRMSTGTFDHGALATDWSRWTPDGSLASK
ncbi:hypothetical protein WDW37_08685 [Bdellovibrionota bacterium FG-1]